MTCRSTAYCLSVYVLGHTADSTPLKATVAGVSKGTRAILLDIVGAACYKGVSRIGEVEGWQTQGNDGEIRLSAGCVECCAEAASGTVGMRGASFRTCRNSRQSSTDSQCQCLKSLGTFELGYNTSAGILIPSPRLSSSISATAALSTARGNIDYRWRYL
jgi:hypothetical protein